MLASFTHVRFGWRHVPLAVQQMGLDRPTLRATPGLRFFRLVGTGRDQAFSLNADLHRWGLFCVWESERALDRFEAGGPIVERWDATGEERWTVRLEPRAWHGRWGGVDPFAGAPTTKADDDEPCAILTRATLRLTRSRTFFAHVGPVADELVRRDGLLCSIGFGEAPVLRQATLSGWTTLREARAFAYGTPDHQAVIRKVRDEGWYREQLFARFRPIASYGRWNGVDPLATVTG